MLHALLKDFTQDAMLIPLVKHVSRSRIEEFAVVSGATGAIHVDPEYCQKTVFKTVLAHGFLLAAYVSEMMENNFGIDWFLAGNLDIQFVGPARPGDSLIITGKVKEIKPDQQGERVICEFAVQNHAGKTVAIGKTEILRNSVPDNSQ